jgi:hypothetical protein
MPKPLDSIPVFIGHNFDEKVSLPQAGVIAVMRLFGSVACG